MLRFPAGYHVRHSSSLEPVPCRFVPEKFEELFSKHDRGGKGALSFSELLALTETNKNAFDAFGWSVRAHPAPSKIIELP